MPEDLSQPDIVQSFLIDRFRIAELDGTPNGGIWTSVRVINALIVVDRYLGFSAALDCGEALATCPSGKLDQIIAELQIPDSNILRASYKKLTGKEY